VRFSFAYLSFQGGQSRLNPPLLLYRGFDEATYITGPILCLPGDLLRGGFGPALPTPPFRPMPMDAAPPSVFRCGPPPPGARRPVKGLAVASKLTNRELAKGVYELTKTLDVQNGAFGEVWCVTYDQDPTIPLCAKVRPTAEV
jgi:hypothetical protein